MYSTPVENSKTKMKVNKQQNSIPNKNCPLEMEDEMSQEQSKLGDLDTLGSALQASLWGAWGGNKTTLDCVRNLQGERTLIGAWSCCKDSRRTVLVCLDLQNPFSWCSDSNTAWCITLGRLCAVFHPTQFFHICFKRQLHRGAIAACTTGICCVKVESV